ncbi:MAG: polymer-forming cytoskeletal protein [Candidatus Neomarinimicrobiota bacterium]
MSKIDFQNVHTMIGADAILEGNINLDGGLIVYGKILGDVNTKGPVRIAKTAEIVGNISASDIQISGIVKGNITVDDRIVLGDQSIVNGDMIYRRLYIEEGAKFSGRCDISADR